MMALILLADYAAKVGRAAHTVLEKAKRGNLKTAQKIGRQWFVDENEPYIDGRVTSGKYVDWRRKPQNDETPTP